MNHDLMQGIPGTTFSNILERDDYDPGKHAVVMLSTFHEILHKWIVDVYLQTPHRGVKDTPAQLMAQPSERLAPSVAGKCGRTGHRAGPDGAARRIPLRHRTGRAAIQLSRTG